MVKRIAMWRLPNENKARELARLAALLQSLGGRVRSLEDVEVGQNQSASHSAYDIVFVATFRDWSALEEFGRDPYHLAVAEQVSAMRASRVVVDYEC